MEKDIKNKESRNNAAVGAVNKKLPAENIQPAMPQQPAAQQPVMQQPVMQKPVMPQQMMPSSKQAPEMQMPAQFNNFAPDMMEDYFGQMPAQMPQMPAQMPMKMKMQMPMQMPEMEELPEMNNYMSAPVCPYLMNMQCPALNNQSYPGINNMLPMMPMYQQPPIYMVYPYMNPNR